MFALQATTRSCTSAVRGASSRTASLHIAPQGTILRRIPVCASYKNDDSYKTDIDVGAYDTTTNEYQAKVARSFENAGEFIRTTWEDTANAEKPAIIAILGFVVVAQIAIAATMDAVDRLPFFGDFFELIGVVLSSVYAYRYISDPSVRSSAKRQFDDFITAVTSSSGSTGKSLETPKSAQDAAQSLKDIQPPKFSSTPVSVDGSKYVPGEKQ